MFVGYLVFLFIIPKQIQSFYSLIDADKPIARVINGKPAALGEVPYQVALKSRVSHMGSYRTFCGAVILSPQKLLSAAHCISEKRGFLERLFGINRIKIKPAHSYVAVAGNLYNVGQYTHDSANLGQWRTIKNATYPENYVFPINDICIIFVNVPFTFNLNVKSIPPAVDSIDYRGTCIGSGFGRTESKRPSPRLLTADIKVVPSRQCSAVHRRNMAKFICILGTYTDMAQGDSGGPLVCRSTSDSNDQGQGVLTGIVSGQRIGVGTFFTRVSSFKKYIETNKSLRVRVTLKFTLTYTLFLLVLQLKNHILQVLYIVLFGE